MTTATFCRHGAYPSFTFTRPWAVVRRLIARNTDRECTTLTTVKVPELVPVPFGVVTVILPVVALFGTVAVICVLLTIVKAALFPLNFTALVIKKPEPLIVTEAPGEPLVGEKLVIFGAVTVNVALLVAVPAGFVTEILPVVAPAGTVVLILLSDAMVKAAVVPLNFTLVVPVKPVPVIRTVVPTVPLEGEKLVIVGVTTFVTVKTVALLPLPAALVTEIVPVVAPDGTVAVI